MRQGRNLLPRVMSKGCGSNISHFSESVIIDQGVVFLSCTPNQGARFVLVPSDQFFYLQCVEYTFVTKFGPKYQSGS
jgi:hypothetical protein